MARSGAPFLCLLLLGCAAATHNYADGPGGAGIFGGGYIEKERAPGVYFIEVNAPVRIFGNIVAQSQWAERASKLCNGKKYDEVMVSEYEYLTYKFPFHVKRGYCVREDAAVSAEELDKVKHGLL